MLCRTAFSVCVSIALFSTTASQAEGLKFSTEKPPFTSTYIPAGSFYMPAHQWPEKSRDPAIAKTLRPTPYSPPTAQEYGDPVYEYESAPQEQWTNPTYPGSRFSYPQQGFYPREGYQQQHPGYEYDFDQGTGYDSHYPMEGASWRESVRATGYSQPPVPVTPTAPAQGYFLSPYPPCPPY